MRKFIKYVLILPLFLGGCSKDKEAENLVPDKAVEVNIKSSSTLTRTAISDDLMSAEWVVGDQIAVWAVESSASAWALESEPFTLKYFGSGYSEANFSASINPMTEGTYTYYSVYPYPVSTNDTQATFSLAASQSGEYDGVNDIMVATPITSSELTTSTIGMPALNFKHLMHVIRIEIPDSRNYFGKELSRLDVTFPQNVVGNVTLDITNPDATPTLANGGGTISVNFAEPFECGSGNYIWMFVNPTTLSGEMTFVAYDSNGSSSGAISTTIERTLSASYITPITLTVPEPAESSVDVTISSAEVLANIGESMSSVTFSAPEGVTFDNGASEITYDTTDDGVYSLTMYSASALTVDEMASSLSVEIETQSVKKAASFTVADNSLAVDVPNFFYTDFSDVTSSGYSGWVAVLNCSWTAGSYMTLKAYSGGLLGSDEDAQGNSCTLENWGLKEDANVTLYITYTATWSKNRYSSLNMITAKSDASDVVSSTNTQALSSSGTNNITATITGATSLDRIVWQNTGSATSWFTGSETVNIDNITVVIVAN